MVLNHAVGFSNERAGCLRMIHKAFQCRIQQIVGKIGRSFVYISKAVWPNRVAFQNPLITPLFVGEVVVIGNELPDFELERCQSKPLKHLDGPDHVVGGLGNSNVGQTARFTAPAPSYPKRSAGAG